MNISSVHSSETGANLFDELGKLSTATNKPGKLADHTIITGIEHWHGGEGSQFNITTAPDTFFGKIFSWITGNKQQVSSEIKEALEAKYGRVAANFAFAKAKLNDTSVFRLSDVKILIAHAESKEAKLATYTHYKNKDIQTKADSFQRNKDILTNRFGPAATAYALSKTEYSEESPIQSNDMELLIGHASSTSNEAKTFIKEYNNRTKAASIRSNQGSGDNYLNAANEFNAASNLGDAMSSFS